MRERILEDAIEFADVLVMIPRPIVKIRLKGVEQMPGADLGSLGDEDAIIVVLAYPNFGKPSGRVLTR